MMADEIKQASLLGIGCVFSIAVRMRRPRAAPRMGESAIGGFSEFAKPERG